MPEVRLVDHNGQNRGVVSTRDALEIAREANLDLVEVAPNSSPPVARIMDYSKFIYERKRKEREARKHQKKIEIKTVKLKVKTAQFHQDLGIRRAREWLLEGKKVKVEIRFYGREMDYPELGHETMAEVVQLLKDISTVEQQPQFDGRTMIMVLTPGLAEVKKE